MMVKTKKQIDKMRESGRIAAIILQEVKSAARVGTTTAHLDKLARDLIKKNGVEPAFLDYGGFPGVLCTSVNDVIVHGVPDDTPLKEGDILGLDFGVIYDGWYSDMAETVLIGSEDSSKLHEERRLIRVTKKALKLGIKKARAGNTTGDVGNTIQRYIESEGYHIVKELVGHGIGRSLHEKPSVPNYGNRGEGEELKKGMTIAIEPMIMTGPADIQLHKDNFGYASTHKHKTAHFEHTVVVGERGADVLTVV